MAGDLKGQTNRRQNTESNFKELCLRGW